MFICDRRLNAWVLEVPPHGIITLKPQFPHFTGQKDKKGVFYFRLLNLKPNTVHALTCEGIGKGCLGKVQSDSSGSVQDSIFVDHLCATFLQKNFIFEREGDHPQLIACGILERDI